MLVDEERELDFNRGVERERGNADGGAGVFAGVAEDIDEEVAGAVDDLRLLAETRRARDEAADAHDGADTVEGAVLALQGRQGVYGALARAFGGVVDRDVVGDGALGHEHAVAERHLAGDEDEVAGVDGGARDVIGDWRGVLGQNDAELLESRGGVWHGPITVPGRALAVGMKHSVFVWIV